MISLEWRHIDVTARPITGWSTVCSAACWTYSWLNINALYYWGFVGNSPMTNGWIPLTKGQWCGKPCIIMTSPCTGRCLFKRGWAGSRYRVEYDKISFCKVLLLSIIVLNFSLKPYITKWPKESRHDKRHLKSNETTIDDNNHKERVLFHLISETNEACAWKTLNGNTNFSNLGHIQAQIRARWYSCWSF